MFKQTDNVDWTKRKDFAVTITATESRAVMIT